MNNSRSTKINEQTNLITQQLKQDFDLKASNPSGMVSVTLPESYIKVMQWLEYGFNESLTTSNGLAVGGTVMDQLAIGLTPVIQMNDNFPQWVFNELNPNTATGIGRRTLCALMGVVPQSAQPTQVLLLVSGEPNTVVDPMSLLISTPTNDPQINIQLFNLDTFTIDSSGKSLAWFVCQEWGEVIITDVNQYKIISQVSGITSVVYDANQGSQIDIGQNEDTDENLKQQTQFSINKLAQNGYSALEGQLIASISDATGIVTMINNQDQTISLPVINGVTNIPKNTTVVSLSCQDTTDNANKIAEILHYNRTGVKYGYAENTPQVNQKTATYKAINEQIETYPWTQTTPKIVQFRVQISAPKSWYNIDDATIKNAIINQFEQGGNKHNKVVQGIPFDVQWFNQAIDNLGLPSYQITMSFIGEQSATILCSKIWEMPVTDEFNISIQWVSQ